MLGDSRYLPLKDKSVNCIITSPPYWNLRKYDVPDLVWDGEEECEHEWGNTMPDHHPGQVEQTIWKNADGSGHGQTSGAGQFCLSRRAWRGQLGLEPTIELYLKHLIQVTDECWRVLRDDGTMWVNIADSYSGSGGEHKPWRKNDSGFQHRGGFSKHSLTDEFTKTSKEYSVPAKSLCLVPERFAIEMVGRGWILRNKIIWKKSNCMPASVKDRFTIDFEPVYFFVKSKKYWFEQQYESQINWGLIDRSDDKYRKENLHSPTGPVGKLNPCGRNRRCVWTIPTQPYPESHFATFPEALIEPMIKAGCPQFVCKKCGKAREKIIETENPNRTRKVGTGQDTEIGTKGRAGETIKKEIGLTDCGCNAGFEPGIILDPFCGSGTVMAVAERLGYRSIGFDLGYLNLQVKRVETVQKKMMGIVE